MIASASRIVLAFVSLFGSLWCQSTEGAAEGRIPAKIVADRLMIRCELSSPRKRIPVHFSVEIDTPGGLELHGRAAQGLELEPGDLVTAHFAGFKIKDLEPEAMGQERADLFQRITKYYGTDLAEIPCVGSIGFQVLKNFHVTFDLNQGELVLAPPASPENDPPADPDGRLLPLEVKGNMAWFPVTIAGNKRGVFLLASSAFDTIVATKTAKDLGRPAGDVGPCVANRVDFAPYVALRPGSIEGFHADGAIGATGLNLFKCFKVEVDFLNHHVRFEPSATAVFPDADFAYFKALFEGGIKEIEEWITKYPAERLAREAAETLIDKRLETALEDEDGMKRAVDWVLKTTFHDRGASRAIELMDKFEEFNLEAFAVYAGKLGVERGRSDRDANAVHKIHGRLGEKLLDAGDLDEAWRHLLSASFGLREDGPINLSLGRLYEKRGKPARAFSRYVQAVITKEAAAKALEGLNRVQKALGGTDKMGIDVIERLIEGRVPAYRTANRFQPTEKNWKGKTVLAQLFNDCQIRERPAPELALDAVASYFAREQVAVLVYQVPMAGANGMMNSFAVEAARDAEVGGPCAIFGGVRRVPGTGREDDKEKFYEAYKKELLEELATPTPYKLAMTAKAENGVVRGELTATGPDDKNLVLRIVLAEKGVLFPSEDKLAVHHWVVRGSLVEGGATKMVRPSAGGTKVSFERKLDAMSGELEADLDELEARAGRSLSLRPTKIDARFLAAVAYISTVDGTVVQAVQIDVTPPPGE